MSELKDRLARLGLSQYHEVLAAEGFDTWETVLDITESDLWATSLHPTRTLAYNRIGVTSTSSLDIDEYVSPIACGSLPATK